MPSSLLCSSSISNSSSTGARARLATISGQAEQLFKRGRLSALETKELMGTVDPLNQDPKRIAKGGVTETNSQNAHRDVVARFGET